MVRKVRVVLEYELGSFSAHQQLPSILVSLNPPSLRIILLNAGSKLAIGGTLLDGV